MVIGHHLRQSNFWMVAIPKLGQGCVSVTPISVKRAGDGETSAEANMLSAHHSWLGISGLVTVSLVFGEGSKPAATRWPAADTQEWPFSFLMRCAKASNERHRRTVNFDRRRSQSLCRLIRLVFGFRCHQPDESGRDLGPVSPRNMLRTSGNITRTEP